MKKVHTTQTANPYIRLLKNALVCLIFLLIGSAANAQTVCQASFTQSTSNGVTAFTNSSTTSTGNPLMYMWSFGDNGYSYDENPTHSYKASGHYQVALQVFDSMANCRSTITDSIHITGICNAAFYYGSNGLTVGFSANTVENGLTYAWSFGDGSSSTDPNVQHTYAMEGSYTVCLVVANSITNCSDTFCTSVKVSPPLACHASFNAGIRIYDAYFQPDTTFAGFADADFEWNFGDGSAISSATFPTHTYAQPGTYYVCLTVTNDSCTDTYCDSVIITGNSDIYGSLYLGNSTIPDAAKIYLIKYIDSSLVLVDVTYIQASDSTAYFTFYDKPAGAYLVKAALDTVSRFYDDYLPTYADTSLTWQNATPVVLNGNHEKVNIHMRAGNNPGGEGFIGGKVIQGANKKEGDPLQDIQVMLFDENKHPVAYTYSNEKGEFSFKNLAFGTYEIYTEVPGLITKTGFAILSESSPKTENVSIRISAAGITTSIDNDMAENFISSLKLYPNPVNNILYLDVEMRKTQHMKLVVYNITGQQVYSNNLSLQAGNQTIRVEAELLPAGLYILQLKNTSGAGQMQYKFVKRN